MKHYTVELRIREAGDVGDELPVSAIVEHPIDGVDGGIRFQRRHHETVGGAVDWAIGKANKWMRNRESKG